MHEFVIYGQKHVTLTFDSHILILEFKLKFVLNFLSSLRMISFTRAGHTGGLTSREHGASGSGCRWHGRVQKLQDSQSSRCVKCLAHTDKLCECVTVEALTTPLWINVPLNIHLSVCITVTIETMMASNTALKTDPCSRLRLYFFWNITQCCWKTAVLSLIKVALKSNSTI